MMLIVPCVADAELLLVHFEFDQDRVGVVEGDSEWLSERVGENVCVWEGLTRDPDIVADSEIESVMVFVSVGVGDPLESEALGSFVRVAETLMVPERDPDEVGVTVALVSDNECDMLFEGVTERVILLLNECERLCVAPLRDSVRSAVAVIDGVASDAEIEKLCDGVSVSVGVTDEVLGAGEPVSEAVAVREGPECVGERDSDTVGVPTEKLKVGVRVACVADCDMDDVPDGLVRVLDCVAV